MQRGMAAGDPVRIGLLQAHDTAPALAMALCSPPDVHGKVATPPLKACSVADYGNSFNPDSQERSLERQGQHATKHTASTKTPAGWRRSSTHTESDMNRS